MRIAIYTLGCKVNQFESYAISERFRELGCEVVDWKQEADLVIVNTCAVTAKAAYQSRQAIRRALKQSPKAQVIATGCYVQTEPAKVMEAVGPDVCLFGNQEKELIPAFSLDAVQKKCARLYIGDISKAKDVSKLAITRPPINRTRVFLKVQDGCNSFCSYCIVPYARGRSRSVPKEMVFSQVKHLSERGVKEIVLTGIHLGHYGKDLREKEDIFSLVQSLCADFPEIRFRLSSIEPTELRLDFVEKAKTIKNFCPHFHIPLQSGSDRVLKYMNRKYSSSFFKSLIIEIRAIHPHASIGTDVMTGFPAEKEEDFFKTAALIESLPISYLHAFPFSARKGTLAAGMKRFATKKEAKERARKLIALGERKKMAFIQGFLGKDLEVLVEKRVGDGLFEGHSENYILVRIKSSAQIKNRIITIKPQEILQDTHGLLGKFTA